MCSVQIQVMLTLCQVSEYTDSTDHACMKKYICILEKIKKTHQYFHWNLGTIHLKFLGKIPFTKSLFLGEHSSTVYIPTRTLCHRGPISSRQIFASHFQPPTCVNEGMVVLDSWELVSASHSLPNIADPRTLHDPSWHAEKQEKHNMRHMILKKTCWVCWLNFWSSCYFTCCLLPCATPTMDLGEYHTN